MVQSRLVFEADPEMELFEKDSWCAATSESSAFLHLFCCALTSLCSDLVRLNLKHHQDGRI